MTPEGGSHRLEAPLTPYILVSLKVLQSIYNFLEVH